MAESLGIVHIRGLAGRFPEAGQDPEKLWSLLLQNADLTCKIPATRFEAEAWPDLPKRAALLENVDCVDTAAFGLKRDEAAHCDPQRFLLLEATMLGAEDAGLVLPLLEPANQVAVFVGCMNGDFQEMVHPSEIPPLFAQGAARSMLAAQVAFAFNFTGALSVLDTACSSSLAAVHQGVRTLRAPAEKTRTAVCLGVNLCLNMIPWQSLQRAGMISERCRTFCHDAAGYGRGEGCGALFLDLQDGTQACCHRAEVLNSCVCSSGRGTHSITKPSEDAQQRCMERTWGKLQDLCQCVEAHGTGTKTGDPVECRSISRLFGSDTACVRPGGVKANLNHLEGAAGMVGVVKMVLCMEKEQQLPFGGGCWSQENSIFDFRAGGLLEPLEYACNWALQPDGRRYAGVNSFGFGGQNAHVALASRFLGAEPGDEGRPWKRARQLTPECHNGQGCQLPPPLLQLSAASPEALESWKELLRQQLEARPVSDKELRSWAHQSTARLSHPLGDSGILRWSHPHRFACPVQSSEALLRCLEPAATSAVSASPYIIFVCCGNGNLKGGVMKELCSLAHSWRQLQEQDQTLPDFPVRQKLEELDRMLPRDFVPGGLWAWCSGSLPVPDDLEVSQVLLFACQVAQAALWAELGVRPHGVVAHSAGETSAAVIAGSLSLQEGLDVTMLRGRAQQRAQQQLPGTMVAAGCSEEAVQKLGLECCELACINTLQDVTVAVLDATRAEHVIEKLESGGASYTKRLPVPTAFHSSLVDGQLEDLESRLKQALPATRTATGTADSQMCQHFSSVIGGPISLEEARDAKLWAQGVRQPVLFQAALASCFRELGAAGTGGPGSHPGICAVELGPGHLLKRYVRQVAQDTGAQASLRLNASTLPHTAPGGSTPHAALVATLAGLWREGQPVRLPWQPGPEAFSPQAALPPRPFHRQSGVWRWPLLNTSLRILGDSAGTALAQPPIASAQHPYLSASGPGARAASSGQEGSSTTVERLQVSREQTPLVYDHLWKGRPLVPGALQAEVALSAFLRAEAGVEAMEVTRAEGAGGARGLNLEIHFEDKCLPGETELALEVHMASPAGRFVLKDSSDGRIYAKGRVRRCLCPADLEPRRLNPQELKRGKERTPEEAYRVLEERAQLRFGRLLAGMRRWWWDAAGQLGLAELELPRELWGELQGCVVPPGLLDMCLQQIGFWLLQDQTGASAIPRAIRELLVRAPEALAPRMLVYFRVQKATNEHLIFSAGLLAMDGLVAVEVTEAVAHLRWPGAESRSESQLPRALEECLYKLAATPLQAPPASQRATGRLALLGDPETPLVKGLMGKLGESSCQLHEQRPDASDRETAGLDLQRLEEEGRAVVYCHTGQTCPDPSDPSFYEALRSDLQWLCRLVLALHKRRARLPLFVVTCRTPLVRQQQGEEKEGLSPAGGAFWGLLKNLVTENLLPEGGETDKWSQLRILELDDPHSEASLSALSQELLSGLRTDAAEVLICKGQPHRLEVVREDWYHRELLGNLSPLQALDPGSWELALASGRLVARKPMPTPTPTPAKARTTVEVTRVLLQPLTCTPRQVAGLDSGSDPCPLGMLDFCGVGKDGEEVICCFPTNLIFGPVEVPAQLVFSATQLPTGLVLSHLLLASALAAPLRAWAAGRQASVESEGRPSVVHVQVRSACLLLAGSLATLLAWFLQDDTVYQVTRDAPSSGSLGVLIVLPGAAAEKVQLPAAQLVLAVDGEEEHLDVPPGTRVHRLSTADLFQELTLTDRLPTLAQRLAQRLDGIVPLSLAEAEGLQGSTFRLPLSQTKWLKREAAQVQPWRPQTALVRRDAAYLVTGALRPHGLGFLNAQWLAQRGAGRVILCGRSARPAQLPELEPESECQVEIWPGLDICDGEALKRKVAEEPSIAGAFHAAAAFQMPSGEDTDGLLLNKEDLQHLDVVLRPKVKGTVALAQALAGLWAPAFLVLHTSVVSLAGNWGQAAYGAANGFQDSYALFLCALGLAAMAVNWSSLDNVGTLHNKEEMVKKLRETRGFVPLSRAAIQQSLEVVLLLQRPQLAISPFDWQKVQASAMIDNPLLRGRFASLGSELALEATGTAGATEVVLSSEDRRIRMLQILSANAPPGVELSEQSTLQELGLDSTDFTMVKHVVKNELARQVALEDLMSLPVGELLRRVE